MPDPFNLPFNQAIAYFRQKYPLPTEVWDDIIGAAQDWAFTVAGVTSAVLLNDIADLIERALVEGISFGEWKKQFKARVNNAGWTGATPWRTELIFRQNLATAYNAGRYQQQTDPDVLKLRPYWQYIHGDTRHPRPHHKALDGKVFLANDPIWQQIYPPNGFGCGCRVVTLSNRDMERENLSIDAIAETATILDKRTGATQQVPAVRINGKIKPIAEPGFAYTPGNNPREALTDQMDRLPPHLRTMVENRLKGQ